MIEYDWSKNIDDVIGSVKCDKNYRILVPVVNQAELFEKCVSKCEDKSSLVVVNNFWNKNVHEQCLKLREQGAEVHDFLGDNRGCAGSWNFGLKHFDTSKIDFVIILSPSVYFLNKIEDMADAINNYKGLPPLYYSSVAFKTDNAGYHAFAIPRSTFDVVGYFDGNMYPVYDEDADYNYRLGLYQKLVYNNDTTKYAICASLRVPRTDAGFVRSLSNAAVEWHYTYCIRIKMAYWQKKWGSGPGTRKYMVPFNMESDPWKAIKYCEPRDPNYPKITDAPQRVIDDKSVQKCVQSLEFWEKQFGNLIWK